MTSMFPPVPGNSVWGITRRMRLASHGCTALWALALAGFGVCVAARGSGELQSAFGVVASAFLTLGYALQAIAHRLEHRALDFAEAQRRELISATSRRR